MTEKPSLEGKFLNCPGCLLKNPHFWIDAWNAVHRNSLSARRRPDLNPVECWNRLAGQVERWTDQANAGGRVARVLAWLERQGVLHSQLEVLDIGAGAGTFTIPLARRVKKVVALEPAPAVLTTLQKKVEAEGLTNVQFLNREWEKVDPVAEGLAGRFDLVFASLTPGVKDVETLVKMMTCSHKWCFLCDLAGQRWYPTWEELWRDIFGEEPPLSPYDISYPFNYLYTSGYFPSVQLWADEWDKEDFSVDEAIVDLENRFQFYVELTSEIKDKIANYIKQHATNGVFQLKDRVRLGMILWRVDERWRNEVDGI
ncbi:methyltransferase domain-containing protein [Aceticella autotrophica]|uniref:Methyltransferase domain-containing protein n=1 Tax=Aceticella autotrophica TaxID=2755338 RepID=A0A975AUP9_9THEO|nr:methyltransferase domain-containing protein [Aceticella autotrophica]QSZ26789.1 methyltransferase domain-containing protein [Aceticella autotrophica]